MIVSVSRRTDIPAFYSKWFFNRLKEGFVYVINPMNPKQVSKIELNPHTVDCFVFWTKDVTPMLEEINKLHGGIWEQIDVKVLAGESMYYYKKIKD
ncbi:Domain of uncharacterised function (DUF1848) [Clostridioides difficile]|nr:Domain of uncharacterised function (DUF1848) [Clostridioides difficile]